MREESTSCDCSENDLQERFGRFKLADETLRRERELLVTKQAALQTYESTAKELIAKKEALEDQVNRLRVRSRTVASRKQINSFELDDTPLARAESLIAEIEKRLDVKDTLLASEGDFQGFIPVESVSTEDKDIATEIEDYFAAVDRRVAVVD